MVHLVILSLEKFHHLHHGKVKVGISDPHSLQSLENNIRRRSVFRVIVQALFDQLDRGVPLSQLLVELSNVVPTTFDFGPGKNLFAIVGILVCGC